MSAPITYAGHTWPSARDWCLWIMRHNAAPAPAQNGQQRALDAYSDEILRQWAVRIREVGIAKGWSVWAAEFMDPDVPFVDTGMPSTETIVAELRRLDRATNFREAAAAIEREQAREERAVRERFGFLDHEQEIEGGAVRAKATFLRRLADATEREKDTSGGHEPAEGGSTPSTADMLPHATAFEVPWPGHRRPLLLQRSHADGDRWMICDREGRRWDRDHGFVFEWSGRDERTRTDTRFPLSEAWQLAQRIAAGETTAPSEGDER